MFRAVHLPTARLWTAVTAVALAVVSLIVLPTLRATPAQASSALQIHRSYGYRVEHGQDFVGAYRMSNGRLIYCINPTYAEPGRVTLHTYAKAPRLSTAATREIAEVLYAHGNAHSNWQAAVVSQTLNMIIGNRTAVARRAHYLPKSVGVRAASYVAEARRAHGPYSMTVSTPTTLYPGQSAHGTVTVRPARAGVVVHLSASSNAYVTRAVRTNSRGTASFTYAVHRPGTVTVVGRPMNLPPTTVLASNPQGRIQRMVTWGAATIGHTSFRTFTTHGTFSHSYGCSSTCNGRPVTTISACVQHSSEGQRVIYRYAGHTKILTWAPIRTRSCKSFRVALADRTRVTGSRQFYDHGWSKEEPIIGSFVIDCPAAPGAAASEVFSCAKNSASVTIALGVASANGGWTPMTNTSTHMYALRIGGAATQTLYAAHGHTASVTFHMNCGDHKTYTFQGGVRRANGYYNWSYAGTVVSP